MRLKEAGKDDLVSEIRQVASLANIHYVRQKEPKGLGNAILCARTFVGNEPFAILLGDDLVVNEGKPALLQLVDAFNLKILLLLEFKKLSIKTFISMVLLLLQEKSKKIKDFSRLLTWLKTSC